MSNDYPTLADQKPEGVKHHWGDVTGVMKKKEMAERKDDRWGDEGATDMEKSEKIKVDKHHWVDEEDGMAMNEDGEGLAKMETRESARHHWEDEDISMGNGIGVEEDVKKKKGMGGWFNRLKGRGTDEVVR